MTPTDLEDIRAVLLGFGRDLQLLTHRVDELAELVTTLAGCVATQTAEVSTLADRTDRAVADVEALTEWMGVLTRGIGRAPLTALPGPSTTGTARVSGTRRAGGHPGGASDADH